MRSDSLGLFWEDVAIIKAKAEQKMKRGAPARIWESDDYLPQLEVAQSYRFDEMSDLEILQAHREQHPLIFDVECYINYFLVSFKSVKTGKLIIFELREETGLFFDQRKLDWVIRNMTLISFNGISYDIPICTLAIAGHGNAALKAATNLLIGARMHSSMVLKQFRCKKMQGLNHIDLIAVAPLQASLKSYAGRVHAKRMQDLPFHFEKHLSDPQICIVKWYNCNDLTNTELLLTELSEQVHLRTLLSNEYGIDVRSKSDAQIAEALISANIEALNGGRINLPAIPAGTAYRYNVPSFIKYESELMKWVLERVRNCHFIVEENGSIGLPPALADLEIKMNKGVYKMGIGGLHSSEKKAAYVATPKKKIKDVDFDSFYPYIILGQGLYPEHLGLNFLRVYKTFVDRRIAAKKAGNKIVADCLKIVINGSFGKLGSCYSNLYAPQLLIQTTITGQLILLMFIERLELAGIEVISANTDGVVSLVRDDQEELFQSIVKSVERDTGFTTEETGYSAIYSRDVNNYAAVKLPDKDGVVKVKGKGIFANPWHPDNKKDALFRFHKNPSSLVCIDAIIALLKNNTPIEETITTCNDLSKFVSVRKVKGGAVKSWAPIFQKKVAPEVKAYICREAGWTFEAAEGLWYEPMGDGLGLTLESAHSAICKKTLQGTDNEYLGESIRWYYAKGVYSDIMYAENGNAVPKSMGAKPCMLLPDQCPDDIDYEWYIKETETILKSIGYLA